MKSENKYKSIEAQRFIDACQRLVDAGIVRSFKEIAEKSGYSSQDFTDIKSGKKDLQRKFLDEVSSRFPLNEIFVLTGQGEFLKDVIKKDIREIEEAEDYKQKEIEMWKELYKVQGELLQEVKKERDNLLKLIDDK